MANHSVLRISRSVCLESNFFPPLFLAPAFQTSCLQPQRPPSQTPSNTIFFSTSASSKARHLKRDKNRSRGVSAIRRTGPRFPLTMSKYPLPEPVDNPPARKQFEIRPDHGLWGFFNHERTSMSLPEDLDAHGRHWTAAELAKKSWEDLRTIWWGCLKEKNWLSTDELERKRVEAGYGDFESQERVEMVCITPVSFFLGGSGDGSVR
jgi:large subunit ribosomal protein L47